MIITIMVMSGQFRTLAIFCILLPDSVFLLTKTLQESTEFTQQEREACLHTSEASMAGTEATTGGRGKRRLKETLNLERREVTDMGRQLTTQDQASLQISLFDAADYILVAAENGG